MKILRTQWRVRFSSTVAGYVFALHNELVRLVTLTRDQYSAGISDVNMYAKAREILLIMGEYFQIQDDYLGEYTPIIHF